MAFPQPVSLVSVHSTPFWVPGYTQYVWIPKSPGIVRAARDELGHSLRTGVPASGVGVCARAYPTKFNPDDIPVETIVGVINVVVKIVRRVIEEQK